MRLLITPSSVLLPQALTTWHSAQCSSIPGPSGQRAAMQGLVVPGSLRLPPRDNRGHCFSAVGFRQQEFFVWRGLWPVLQTQIDSCFALSLSDALGFAFFFFPLTFSGIGVSYFNISASLELTIEARRGHAHSAISSPCLVLVHSPGAPILPLSSLTRKCASVWTLFSSWYLTSGLPRALPSLPSKSLYFALASSFQRSHLLQPLVLPSRKLRLLRQTPLPRTPPWAVHTVFCCRRSSWNSGSAQPRLCLGTPVASLPSNVDDDAGDGSNDLYCISSAYYTPGKTLYTYTIFTSYNSCALISAVQVRKLRICVLKWLAQDLTSQRQQRFKAQPIPTMYVLCHTAFKALAWISSSVLMFTGPSDLNLSPTVLWEAS